MLVSPNKCQCIQFPAKFNHWLNCWYPTTNASAYNFLQNLTTGWITHPLQQTFAYGQMHLSLHIQKQLMTKSYVFLHDCTFFAVIGIWNPRSSTDDTATLVWPVIAFITYPNQSAGTYIWIAYHALAITWTEEQNNVNKHLIHSIQTQVKKIRKRATYINYLYEEDAHSCHSKWAQDFHFSK